MRQSSGTVQKQAACSLVSFSLEMDNLADDDPTENRA